MSNVAKTRIMIAAAFVLAACSDQSNAPLDVPAESAVKLSGSSTANWQEEARTQVAAHSLGPLPTARLFALLSVAQYAAIDALQEPNDEDDVLPETGYGEGGKRRFELQRGALAGASMQVLKFFFADSAAAIDRRFQAEEADASGEQFSRGLQVGMETGDKLVERTRNDHFTDPWTGAIPVGPGMWFSNGTPPIGATFSGVTPYFLSSSDQFRSAPPPAFGSAEYQTDLDEIRGISDTRTQEQLDIARFWNFGPATYTPVGYWDQLAAEYASKNRWNERATAHVFALMNAAELDALIGCWEAKYYYWQIRPSQADGAITLPIGLPNHPSYPSGHSCGSSAATTVLAHFFPEEASGLQAKMIEAGLSRMYAGIHYRSDISAGQTLGTSVAQLAIGIDGVSGLLSTVR